MMDAAKKTVGIRMRAWHVQRPCGSALAPLIYHLLLWKHCVGLKILSPHTAMEIGMRFIT